MYFVGFSFLGNLSFGLTYSCGLIVLYLIRNVRNFENGVIVFLRIC